MGISIKKIAEIAGVSRGTVDRALNNRPGVNQEVAKEIKRIAAELNYEPNSIAKALANSKKSCNLGILMNSEGNPFFEKVLRGIGNAEKEVKRFGVNVITKELRGYDSKEQLEAIDEMLTHNLKGLIISPINDQEVIKRLNEVADSGIFVSTINVDVKGIEKKLCFVGCDYIKSGQTAGEVMGQISSGSRKAVIVSGSEKILGHNNRIKGFSSVIKQNYPEIEIAEIAYCHDSDEIAYSETKRLLEAHSPNAVYFCAGGIDGGIKAICDSGLAQKIKIITVDDTDNVREYIKNGIVNATICQQPIKQGYLSVISQYDMIINRKPPKRRHLYCQNEVKFKYNLD